MPEPSDSHAIPPTREPVPFFIVGCPRSGTSLVSQLLDNHPQLAVYHETQYYPVFRPHLPYYGDLSREADARALIGDLRAWLRLQGATPPPAEQLMASSFEGVLSALLGAYARSQGKARAGDKTPEHHTHLAEITTKLPHSPVIFVIRDPRDTIRSFRKAFGASIEDAARAWNRAFASHQRFSDRVQTVRYEELVQDPAGVLAPVCAALGTDFEPQMLRFYERVPERLRSLPNVERLTSPVSAGSVGSYRELPATEIRRIEELCAEGMATLGYEFSGARPRVAPHIAAAPPGRRAFVRERVRYYWRRPDRMRMGWFRWRIVIHARARHAAHALAGRTFGWIA